jgi:hypothetical protein
MKHKETTVFDVRIPRKARPNLYHLSRIKMTQHHGQVPRNQVIFRISITPLLFPSDQKIKVSASNNPDWVRFFKE